MPEHHPHRRGLLTLPPDVAEGGEDQSSGLGPELARAATRFGRTLGEAGLLHVTGAWVPADLPPTPDRPYTEVGHPIGTESPLLALASLVGEVISFADWHAGARVQNLYPLRGEASRQNASNAVYLEMHTETAFRPNTPDALVLLCLRADERVGTLACDLLDVWAELDPGTRRALAEPAFAFRLPDGTVTEPKPVASRWRGRLRFNYAEALCAVGEEYERPLRTLREGIADRTVTINLRTGDLLLIDNTHLVHGRTAYQPRYDGTDRWLQRCLIRAAA
ncbi:TauD/TfdA family dioxygenase [Microbispora sp. H10670]|uniref:TauD/TfdA family dioxygenase n=1 Tax=Microbispora sp. H10670 TaxID=2729108 RepID=UPI0016049DFC|nr:TauD/TfdA family dioxygenase [Microbispora sp. H10670]